jgi:hypothetical protein
MSGKGSHDREVWRWPFSWAVKTGGYELTNVSPRVLTDGETHSAEAFIFAVRLIQQLAHVRVQPAGKLPLDRLSTDHNRKAFYQDRHRVSYWDRSRALSIVRWRSPPG